MTGYLFSVATLYMTFHLNHLSFLRSSYTFSPSFSGIAPYTGFQLARTAAAQPPVLCRPQTSAPQVRYPSPLFYKGHQNCLETELLLYFENTKIILFSLRTAFLKGSVEVLGIQVFALIQKADCLSCVAASLTLFCIAFSKVLYSLVLPDS